jgi:hypothetical protein
MISSSLILAFGWSFAESNGHLNDRIEKTANDFYNTLVYMARKGQDSGDKKTDMERGRLSDTQRGGGG